MRAGWLILVGITVLGCKDKDATKPAEQHSAVPAGSGSGVTAVKAAPNLGSNTPAEAPADARPSDPVDPKADALAREFAEEPVDNDFATNATRAIQATAPFLKDIDCRTRHCRATVTASNEKELVERVEKLQADEGLRGADPFAVILTAPDESRTSMKIYVRFER